MPKIAKKQQAAREQVDRAKKYTLDEACALVKKAAPAKFDETVDLAVRLGVNPRHADQMVRGAVVLPHGTGQALRVARLRQGREGARRREQPAPTSWARRTRGQGPGRLHGLRPRDRHARHDGPGRQARAHPRPARPHAQPQGRHRHVRREDGRLARPRRARSSTASRRPASSTPASARSRSTSRRSSPTPTRSSRRSSAPSRRRRRASTCAASRCHSTMGPGVRIDPLHFGAQDGGGLSMERANKETQSSRPSKRSSTR